MSEPGSTTRSNQKLRTRMAIVDAARAIASSGAEVTMPRVATAALVSEATAYRYFPDLHSLLLEALWGAWPQSSEATATVAGTPNPVDRVTLATELLLRRASEVEGGARAFISATVARPERGQALPSFRAKLIELALVPLTEAPTGDPGALAELAKQLCAIASPELLFTLVDACGLSNDEAIASATQMAQALVRPFTT